MMLARCLTSLGLLIGLGTPSAAFAGEIIYASHKYVMGDNDTKTDARKICFIEAKRKAIEKAGTYLESTTEIRNFQLAKDEINTFAGAILKVEIASEEVKFSGESVVIYMTVKADVDVDSFREKVSQIKADRNVEAKVKEQQAQIATMEGKIRDLQKSLATKPPEEVVKARVERKEAFEKIDELEAVRFAIRQRTERAVNNVILGMTINELDRVVGPPRVVGAAFPSLGSYELNYGDVWVIFETHVLSCVVRTRVYQRGRSCDFYRSYRPSSVVK